MGVSYLLRSCPITGVLLIEGIIGEANETTISGKSAHCFFSYLVLSMFVSVPRSVRHRKPSFPQFSL